MGDVRAFLREYADLVRRHGVVWSYDGDWSTPDELSPIDVKDFRVVAWLGRLDQGQSEPGLRLHDVPT